MNSWAFLGSLGTLLAAFWGILGPSWGASLGILGGVLDDKASKMLPKRPKEPTQGSKRLPEGLQMASKNVSKGPSNKEKNNLYYLIVVV